MTIGSLSGLASQATARQGNILGILGVGKYSTASTRVILILTINSSFWHLGLAVGLKLSRNSPSWQQWAEESGVSSDVAPR